MLQLPPLSHCATPSQSYCAAEAEAVDRPNGMAAKAPVAATKPRARVLIFRFLVMVWFPSPRPPARHVATGSLPPGDRGSSGRGAGLPVFDDPRLGPTRLSRTALRR